jgi:RNA 2',3'-cyclic 3'-phosphodiesterase
MGRRRKRHHPWSAASLARPWSTTLLVRHVSWLAVLCCVNKQTLRHRALTGMGCASRFALFTTASQARQRSTVSPIHTLPRFRKRDLGLPFLMLPSKRLFVGLELPASCKTTLLSLDPQLTGLRWVVDEQLHLTLSFLGNVDTVAEDRLREALDQVRVPAFFLPLCGVEVFNVRGQPSVVWAGVGNGHPHLFLLHRRIQDAVLHAGLEPDLKPFHPHVTVGRPKGISRQALQPFIRQYAEADLGLFEVTGFGLYSSVLSPVGAVHHLEMRQDF